jgi:galactokinase
MRDTERKALEAYRGEFGGDPEVLASAPGRVNLIGEHTDYNDGFVLPCAIDRRIAVAVGSGEGGLLSVDFGDTRPLEAEDDSWARYPRGVVWALREAGHEPGPFQAAYAGDVPRASGLSSSAAIEAATALALNTLYGLGIEGKNLAVLCQRAENGYVGVASGIMDQYASILCERGAALLIDCRSLEATPAPLDLAAADLALLVCDTRVERGLADTGYNDRRAACERAADTLGVEALRDAAEGDLARLSGEDLKRARHIVTENARVLEAVEALQDDDFARFGDLMYRSHDSMRDDFEISTPELDSFVETAAQAGAVGARLTGAGFGGCAIALVGSGRVEALTEAVRNEFGARGFGSPDFYTFLPADGAEVVLP